jgi:hypothetical protein
MSTPDDRSRGAHAAPTPTDTPRRDPDGPYDGTTGYEDDLGRSPHTAHAPRPGDGHDGRSDDAAARRTETLPGPDRDRDGVPDRVDRHDDRHDDRHGTHDDRHDDRVGPSGAAAAGAGVGALSARSFGRDRETVLAREREEFGGMKFGSAFFGWLAAMGTAVILTALAAAVGTAVGLATDTTAEEAADAVGASPETVGWVSAIVLLVILFVSYFAGGYVAGRMARFDGAKQGVAVWLWALVVAIAVAVLGLIAGAEFNVLADVNAFPRIPVNEGDVTTVGIVVALVVALAALVGAVLGGITGMRYHRRVDRVGLGA